MKKVNFNVAMKNADGEIIKDENGKDFYMGKAVSNLIMASKATKDPARMFDVAIKMRNSEGELELEDADFIALKEIIEASDMTVLMAGQIKKIMGK